MQEINIQIFNMQGLIYKSKRKFQKIFHDKSQIVGMSNVFWCQQILRVLQAGKTVENSIVEKSPKLGH